MQIKELAAILTVEMAVRSDIPVKPVPTGGWQPQYQPLLTEMIQIAIDSREAQSWTFLPQRPMHFLRRRMIAPAPQIL